MHDDIERFSLDGEIDSTNLVEAKERLIHFLEASMRDAGFVPCLDLEPQFTRQYNAETEKYNFEISVYGIKVGRAEACETAGVMGGKMIMSSMPKHKLKQ